MIASGWHFNGDTLPSQGEVDAMAAVLEGRHGEWAAEVADFFATAHTINGDKQRAWAWTGVAETVRRKVEERLSDAH